SKASEIASAIRDTFKGESILEPEVTGKMMHRMRQKNLPHESLTPREFEVLLLVAEGKSNLDISEDLYIAVKTVKVQISNILGKRELDDRHQDVDYVYKKNLIKSSSSKCATLFSSHYYSVRQMMLGLFNILIYVMIILEKMLRMS